jgi:hypothetical protein
LSDLLEVEVLLVGRDPGVSDPHRTISPAVPRSPPGPVSQIPGVQARVETLISRRVRETGNGLAGWPSWQCPRGLIERPFRETVE